MERAEKHHVCLSVISQLTLTAQPALTFSFIRDRFKELSFPMSFVYTGLDYTLVCRSVGGQDPALLMTLTAFTNRLKEQSDFIIYS